MPVKVLWDYTYYWGVMCQLYYQNKLWDISAMGRLQKTLASVQKLNVAVQNFLRDWDAAGRRPDQPRMLDQAAMDWFAELNRGLADELTPEAFQARLQDHLGKIDTLALQIVAAAQASYPTLGAFDVRAALSDPSRANRPLGESLLFPHKNQSGAEFPVGIAIGLRPPTNARA